MITALRNTTQQDAAFVAQSLFGPPQRHAQRRQRGAADIAQLHPLEIVPDAFDRVEFRGIAGQWLQMEALGGSSGQEVLDGLPTMNRRAIPDEEQLAGNLAQEHAQEPHDIDTVIALRLGLQEEPSVW